MGRYSRGVKIIEEAKVISITKLQEWGYLTHAYRDGTISWYRNGQKYSSISIKSIVEYGKVFIELSYTYRDSEDIKYRVKITYVKSNLGVGHIPYFICPSTGKRCRKLYMFGKYFLYREAYSRVMYENQVESKKMRSFSKIMGPYYRSDIINAVIYAKHFKRTYNGIPTKRYLKLKKKLDAVDRNFDYSGFLHRAMIS